MPTNHLTERPDCWPQLCQRLGIRVAPIPTNHRPSAQIPAKEWFSPKSDGERTAHLVSMAGQLLASGCGLDAVTAACLTWNATNTPPMDDSKVIQTCKSLEQTDRRQHPERARRRDAGTGILTPLFDLKEARIDGFLSTLPPPQRWLLTDFLPLGITGAVVSPGGVGKSQLLMQLAYSVATGFTLAGKWPVAECGSVLMLCAEDGANEIHRRVHRIHTQIAGASNAALTSQLTARLFIRSTIGQDTLMTAKNEFGEVTRTAWPERLLMTVQSVPDLKLIIIDPASRFRGGEENSNEDGTRFIEALEFVAQRTGATVMIAHHSNKGALNSTEGANQGHARGASALVDGLRWQMALTTADSKNPLHRHVHQAQQGHYLEAKVVKSNYTAPQPPTYLRREDDGYLQAVGAGVVVSGPDPHLLKLLTLLNGTLKLTAKDIELGYCGHGKPIPLAQKRVRDLIKSARSDGLLVGQGRQPIRLTTQGLAMAPTQPQPARRGAGKNGAAKPAATKIV